MKKIASILFILILIGLLIPSSAIIPVKDASCNDWNHQTFWYEPWSTSGVHKGIDVFAINKTPVLAATSGLVLFSGEISKGGNIVVTLGPKWRIHYYAHLNSISEDLGLWVTQGTEIGQVGRTGNAQGKPAHLHYSVLSLIPYVWLITTETQGWKKMFYLDPARAFETCV